MTDPDRTSGGKAESPGSDSTRTFEAGETMAEELIRVLDGYMADLQAGKVPDRDQLLADNPGIAKRLEQCLPGIEFIHQAAGPELGASRQLGDFQIIGEIGRGGMGVVYEARQVSLNRRVALKVLRFGAVADKDAMERFRHEAEMVAQLHHTNIVPIFAIGEQHGVSYYGMQLIEGRSLAAVSQESRDEQTPLEPARVAQWGLQAAEALAHAHQRGVIHRDIKPSNLILDPEGQIWLTDFGLAKRMDDVTLSVTGALVGTPRYMSPEQASAAKLPVDQRTDIYSLGATLYELATGKPLFEAATAHEVISQILTVEPASPRSVRADLPKDLETIILKCLSKESHQRYPTAQLLADDVRAFAEGRAIKARRVSLPERAVRWARKQKRSMVLAAISAVAAIVLVGAGVLAWYLYDQHNRMSVGFTTTGPVLQASILRRDGEVAARTRIPHEGRISLQPGDYRLRIASPGHFAQTYDFRHGGSYAIELRQPSWPPLQVPWEGYDVVDLAGRAEVIVGEGANLRRLDAATGKVIWDVNLLDKPSQPALANVSNSPALASSRRLCPPTDLDGDGTRDLIWTTRNLASGVDIHHGPAAVLAVSGSDGKVLWTAPFRPFLPEPPQSGPARADRESTSLSNPWAGIPAAADIDGDGTPDLIVPYRSDLEDALRPRSVRYLGQEWVEALSGRTGKVIWRHLLRQWGPKGPTYEEQALQVPPPSAEPGRLNGTPVVFCQAGPRVSALEAATGRLLWEAADLGRTLVRTPEVADLDADGNSDVLAVAEQSDGDLALLAVSGKTRQAMWTQVVCQDWRGKYFWDSKKRAQLRWPVVDDLDGDGRCELVVAIVPPGPKVSRGRRLWAYSLSEQGHSGVEVLDGATGRLRWRRGFRVGYQDPLGVEQFIVGPDLDGDGHKEVFVATGPRSPHTGHWHPMAWSHVDALSGKDGRTLWWRAVSCRGWAGAGSLEWFQAGPDGWPRLLVRSAEGAHVLSAATGRVEAELVGKRGYRGDLARDVQTGDLDDDGLTDFCVGFLEPQEDRQEYRDAYRVHALRGQAPQAWQRLGQWSAVQDLDGDGIADVIRPQGWHGPGEEEQANPELVTAVSGRDGRILWQGQPGRGRVSSSGGCGGGTGRRGNPLDDSLDALLAAPAHVKAFPLPHGDLDGDGAADLLVFAGQFRWATQYVKGGRITGQTYGYGTTPEGPLVALSGKTGRRLWTSDAEQLCPPNERPPRHIGNCLTVWPQLLSCRDLDGDGRAEVILPYCMADRFCLAVLAARDGKLVWRQQLGEPAKSASSGWAAEMLDAIRLSPAVGDLDGDGARDIVAVVKVKEPGDKTWQVRALSGRDGKLLWEKDLSAEDVQKAGIGDLDGDGKCEVVLNQLTGDGGHPRGDVLALDGRTGQPKWTWPWPDKLDMPAEWCCHACVPVLADLDGDGRMGILIGLTRIGCSDSNRKGEVFLLDAGGQVRQRAEVEQPWHGGPCLRAFDLDGDGKQELLFFVGGKLRVTCGGLERVLWERPSETHSARVEVLPPAGGRPATVLSWEKDDLFALDGPTGRPLWRAEARDPLGSPQGLVAVLPSSDRKELPRLLYRPEKQDATLCRLALPTDASGRYAPPTPTPIVFAPPPRDPRLARALPWAPSWETGLVPRGAYEVVLVSVPAVFLMVVLPWLLVRWALRQRSWGRRILAGMYLLGVVAAIAAFIYLGMVELARKPVWYVLLMVLALGGTVLAAGMPWVAFLGCGACWALRRRWRKLGLLLGGAVVLTLGVVGLAVLLDPRTIEPEEYYQWDGWYWAWLFGAYGTGAVLVITYLIRASARGVRRLIRRCGEAPAIPT